MTSSTSAETAITTSALIVGGIYIYRRLVEPAGVAVKPAKSAKVKNSKTAQAVGIGPVPSVGQFVVGWGFTYLVVSIMAQASPGLGKAFAVLIATTCVIGNGLAISQHVNDSVGNHVTEDA